MPCYFIGEVDVRDAAGYKAYADAVPAILEKFGGKFLAKGGVTETLEGFAPQPRIALVEFPDMETARAFWHSPEYRAIAPIRNRTAVARAFLVEGTTP
ncbi:MAG: DUF1330 domain-containing protein [Bosea sp. (in: a-proteobacteria)]|jgi:uncharacterized protein (DUF1330 family)